MATRNDAKAAVTRIMGKYGVLLPARLREIEDEVLRRELEGYFLAISSNYAHLTKVLAETVYCGDARFIFELLQNADDNQFKRAEGSGALPFISFQRHPDRIIVECNEDGFTEDDLSAICAVGESTKSGVSHGYIGAKGIGFKSVFATAKRVSIRSGYFSFYFENSEQSSGLGMIVPMWDDNDAGPPCPVTRMTLDIKKDGTPDELEDRQNAIDKQLIDLQYTCLLFLRRIKEIRVAFYDSAGELVTSKNFCFGEIDMDRVFIKVASTGPDSSSETSVKHYHRTKHEVLNLTRRADRTSSSTEAASDSTSSAEVVLAFPLTDDSKPLVGDRQYLFTFLPVRETSFKFLIHSDFDTNASREDILTGTERNTRLRDGVASAFMKAVRQFRTHQDLCYTWPAFLPLAEDRGASSFWVELVKSLSLLIPAEPVLRSQHGMFHRKIAQVFIPTSDVLDDNGEPLFDNHILDPFISEKYPTESVRILKKYGLQAIQGSLFLDLLQADLRSPWSRLRSESTNRAWHTALATKLCSFFKGDLKQELALRLESFRLIPLRTGQWVSAGSGQVYFSLDTEGIAIPAAIQLRIIDPAAVECSARRELFDRLGVLKASILLVRQSICSAYPSHATTPMGVEESNADLRYLYATYRPDQDQRELEGIRLISCQQTLVNPFIKDIYLPTDDDPYGPKTLLKLSDKAPGMPVNFIHTAYHKDIPHPPTAEHPSWDSWLCNYVGVRERLRLVSRVKDSSLSREFKYVAQYVPEKLLGLLRHLWPYEGARVNANTAIQQKIKDISASQLCGQELLFKYTLADTWLPLPHLRDDCFHFMGQHGRFPFLELGHASSESEINVNWMFLHDNFSVGKDCSITFLLEVLTHISGANDDASTIREPHRVFNLYRKIDRMLTASPNTSEERERIRNHVDSLCGIFVPAVEAQTAYWVPLDGCRWKAPYHLTTIFPLQALYNKAIGEQQTSSLKSFFRHALSIPDADWEDLVNELADMKEGGCGDRGVITDVYRYISNMDLMNLEGIRQRINEESLIFSLKDGNPGWYKISECFWSTTTEIRGKVALNGQYDELEGFFIDTLGVKRLTLQMVYDDLFVQPSPQRTVEDVKSIIWSLNALLQTETGVLDHRRLLRASVFPIRSPNRGSPRRTRLRPRISAGGSSSEFEGNGGSFLGSADTDFAIADREYLFTRFSDQIKLLDYTLEEIRILRPFLEWANLEDRYLSRCVKETTSVSGGESRPITAPNRDLKRKAHALLRIAATFGSPKYRANADELWEILRTIQVVEATGISSVLSISQDGVRVKVKQADGVLHIDDSDVSRLKIYVPIDPAAQGFSFGSPLPAALAEWLMTNLVTNVCEKVNGTLVAALIVLLQADISAVDRTLDYHGIVQLPVPNGYPEPELESDDSTMADMEDNINLYEHRPSMPPVRHSAPAAPLHTDTTSENTQYLTLLNRIIAAARVATFPSVPSPSTESFDMTGLSDALHGDAVASFHGLEVDTKFRSKSQFERDKKIGAAGELYVFEVLSQLDPGLHGWSRQNWQSRIRHYVAIHPSYIGMLSWLHLETADLTYEDTMGNLTAMLIDHGYLAEDEWRDARSKYFIEVKSTTGPCNTPFYMSKGQYRLMRETHRSGPSEVYMIVRVFDLESKSPGMRLYLDPEQLRADGDIVFTAQTWSIVPGNGLLVDQGV